MRAMIFDTDTKQFVLRDGGVAECSGREGVQQWLHLALHVSPASVPVYHELSDNTRFGVDVLSLLGSRSLPAGFVRAEVERQITELCGLNPYIVSVGAFRFGSGGQRTLTVAFTVTTQDGEKQEVNTSYDGR